MDSVLNYPILKSKSVVDGVKDWIVDQMIAGNIHPGDKLPTETELCSSFGASRNSIREAIKQLEAYGIVHIKRAEGTFITDSYDSKMLSPILYSLILQENNWDDFVQLRRAIDIGTLYVIMDKPIREQDLDILKDALDHLDAAVSSEVPDASTIVEADVVFHRAVILLANNPQLSTMADYINRITVPSRRATTESVLEAGAISQYADLHHRMYEIIKEHRKDLIEKTVNEHYVFWAKGSHT